MSRKLLISLSVLIAIILIVFFILARENTSPISPDKKFASIVHKNASVNITFTVGGFG